MNIQIFGKTKCQETKKAERFFQERKIKFQFIDINAKGLSNGELNSVIRAVGGVDKLFNTRSKAYESLNVAYITRSAADKAELFINNFDLYATPIVRNGTAATVGYCPDIWKEWK